MMITPARITDTVRYDQTQGVISIDNGPTAFAEYASVEDVADALQALSQAQWLAPFLAGYGLVLAARAWAERPSDARRGAIIQAGEQLGNARPASAALHGFIAECLDHADRAVLAGENAETALVAFVATAAQHADRRAERCGRRAAALIQAEDHVLVVGDVTLALMWMLAVAADDQPDYRLVVVSQAWQLAAHKLGRPATLLAAEQLAAGVDDGLGMCVAAAAYVALDGSMVARDTQRYALLAAQLRVPVYALADSGPNPQAATEADLPPGERIPPDLISAIVTDRGMYRAAMIARYNEGGAAPLDVIPLTG